MREETKIHRKSRLGCLTCKRRKVKCDETRPECIKCFKFGVPCDYSSSNIQASHSSPSPSNTASNRSRGRPRSDWASWAEQIRISSATQSRSSSEAGSSCLCDTPRLNVDDLELFYNYLNNTACTLGDDSHHALWQKGVPELGFQYPCVLDLILALSALHLARKRPEKRTKYEAIAEQHSTAALQAATALMKDMSKDNCPALYISAVLICFTSFAKGPSPGNMLVVADDGQVPWLSLIRGVRFVVSNMGWSAVFSGVLAKYAPQGTDPQNEETIAESLTPSTLAATGSEDWRTSLEMISDLFTILPSQQCRYIYMREVESLVSHLETTFGTGMNALPETVGKMENIMGWMYSIREDFVKRLSQRHPVALIILGHFCVLLRTLEGYWFMQGWAQHVMREVIAATDEACHKWLAWPIKFLEDANSITPYPVTP